jgi:cytochrome c5
MSKWRIVGALTILGVAAAASGGQSPAPGGSSKSSVSDEVVRIKLPDYAVQTPKGPNVQVYEKNCLICHSARYVTTQPGFNRSTWEKEVKKMVDGYGANISEADQRKIVDYLVAIRGAQENK